MPGSFTSPRSCVRRHALGVVVAWWVYACISGGSPQPPAALLDAGPPLQSAATLSAGESALEGSSLRELFSSKGRPMFYSRGAMGLCVAWLERQDSGYWLDAYHFVSSSVADGGAETLAARWRSTPAQLDTSSEQIAAHCGDSARLFLMLTAATCQEPQNLERLLHDPRALTYAPSVLAPELEHLPFMKVERNFFQAAGDIGCARCNGSMPTLRCKSPVMALTRRTCTSTPSSMPSSPSRARRSCSSFLGCAHT
jgi:hypothetical protein